MQDAVHLAAESALYWRNWAIKRNSRPSALLMIRLKFSFQDLGNMSKRKNECGANKKFCVDTKIELDYVNEFCKGI